MTKYNTIASIPTFHCAQGDNKDYKLITGDPIIKLVSAYV